MVVATDPRGGMAILILLVMVVGGEVDGVVVDLGEEGLGGVVVEEDLAGALDPAQDLLLVRRLSLFCCKC